MKPFPHLYTVKASGDETGDVKLAAERLAMLRSASPAEFDGPGDRWSPETLLVGAVADCFILTFRAVAKASNVCWRSLECEVTGTLDRLNGAPQFSRFDVAAHLVVGPGQDPDRARHALEKAERNCLISRSLKGPVALSAVVEGEQHEADGREGVVYGGIQEPPRPQV
jgi:organic hydroperoxide reductase OsmC/OhrA